MTKEKKVMVSGCYDLIHGGHIAFFKTAASYGKLYVMIGQDHNLLQLKGKAPYFSEKERKYIVESVKYVHEANISTGSGILDFEPDMRRIKPDIFIVNSDGHNSEKEKLCRELGVEYIVLERIPEPGLPPRSSSGTKKDLKFPYRICIAGGWIDQPWVSEIHPGSVVVAQLWPTIDFNDRSGMATSSRKIAIELWEGKIPGGDPVRNAKLLFGAENPPDCNYVSGSQDQIGLMVPGINRLWYDGGYWPEKIENCINPEICDWLSDVLHLVPVDPRPAGFDPIAVKNLEKASVRELGEAGTLCWESILKMDVAGLGRAMTATFLAWRKILPNTVPDWLMKEMEEKYFPGYAGAISSGSGGGYIVVASENKVEGAIKVRVRY
jgi:cytidyltransferase-like protein